MIAIDRVRSSCRSATTFPLTLANEAIDAVRLFGVIGSAVLDLRGG